MKKKTHAIVNKLYLSLLLTFALSFFNNVQAQTVLNNQMLRFGTGTQESVNIYGNLMQPWYYSASAISWYPLTYSSYALDIAYRVGGDGTNEWNINGNLVENPTVENQVISTTEYIPTGSGAGYGTVTSSGTVTIGTITLDVDQAYHLPADKAYMQSTIRLTNNTSSDAQNLRVWIGTRDDWVGISDGPVETKGNIVDGAFDTISTQTERSLALQITSGSEGVLFYTTSEKANTISQGCCSFSNVYNSDPATSPIIRSGDGSYGFYVRLNDLAPGESDEFTWFYAAGELADLANIIKDVADVSGASNVFHDSTSFSVTTNENATGYWITVPEGSAAPNAEQIKAGVNYDAVTVVAGGSEAMTADVEQTIPIEGLTPGTSYTVYFVYETSEPAFSEISSFDFTTDLDTDGDDIGNNLDEDDDNDGLSDDDEMIAGSDPLNPDTDGDGTQDGADAFPVDETEDTDTDGDGIGNNADPDDDNDGVSDADENAMGTDPLNPDSDNDGTMDGTDAFPLDDTEDTDTDNDGIGNNADTDDD
ncbi:MAG: hypothetical protein ACOCUP_01150, partial [bacterium]